MNTHNNEDDYEVCAQCAQGVPHDEDDQAARMEAYIESTKEKIDKHGWVVQGVIGSEDSPGWAYTIGLRQFDHPEIVIVNLPNKIAHAILNLLGDRVRDGEKIECDRLYDEVVSNYAVLFKEVPDPSDGDWFNVMEWVYGNKDWPVIQMFWPDFDGNFPWQDGYDQRYLQEVVGI